MARHSALPYVALAAVCIIWGTTYLALRIAVLHFPPFLFTALRQTCAGLLLLAFMLGFAKASLPSRQQIAWQAIGGFFMITLGNGLVAWAEVHIPSGVAAVICSLVPVMVIVMNVLIHREDRPNFPIVAGVVLGLIGIVVIFSEHLEAFSETRYILGIIFTFTAALAWAGASIWIKKRQTEANLFINAGLQMFFGGLFLFPLSVGFDDLSHITWTGEVAAALLYLVVFGSLVGYAAYAYALRKLPMTIVSLYAYINPLVAVVLGWLVLEEALNIKIGFAMALTITGIYIVNRGYQLRDAWRAQFSAER